MGKIGNHKKFFLGFGVLSVVFILLRMRTLGHLLMWDEAWNILSLRAFITGAETDPFYWFFFYHPPLYMLFGKFLLPFQNGFAVRMEMLSLVFAYFTFLVMYVISARLGGWRYAWFSGLFLSFMPASIGYDTWVKKDGLASLFGYLALLLVLKKRFIWCGIALALSLLSKENGVFFVMSVFVLVFLLKEKNPFKKISGLSLVVFIFSSWWYLFFSTIIEHGKDFFSKTSYSHFWLRSPLYYINKLSVDIGPVMLFFLGAGLLVLTYKAIRKKQYRWFLPVVTCACIYLPISLLFSLKTPWLMIPARPALAMIAAGGAVYVFNNIRQQKLLTPLFYILLLSAVLPGLTFSYQSYHSKTYRNGWPGADASNKLAVYLNENMDAKDKLLISPFEYWKKPVCPIFLYYWNPHAIKLLRGTETAEEIVRQAVAEKYFWIVLIPDPAKEVETRKTVQTITALTKKSPTIVGWSYVWDLNAE